MIQLGEEWEAKAEELLESQSFEDTMKFLLQVLQHDPKNPRLYYFMGRTHHALGKFSDAIAAYDRALQLNLRKDEAKEAYLGMGMLLRATGKYKEANEIFKEALQRFNTYRPLRVFFALTLFNLGDYGPAFEILLRQLAETTSDESLEKHRKTMAFYADNLPSIFED
jgi:tetratricopeptide (TPR) repeat protein